MSQLHQIMNVDTPKDYVKSLAVFMAKYQTGWYFKYILENGRAFETTSLKADVQKKVQKFLKYFKPKPKSCFYNAQSIVIDFDEFEYWEGFAIDLSGVKIPLEHGWNVVNGEVVDITWQKEDQHILYFGCKIPTSYVRDRWLKDSYSQGYLIDYVAKILGKR